MNDLICNEINRCVKKLLGENERYIDDLMKRVKAFAIASAAKMRIGTNSNIYGEKNIFTK